MHWFFTNNYDSVSLVVVFSANLGFSLSRAAGVRDKWVTSDHRVSFNRFGRESMADSRRFVENIKSDMWSCFSNWEIE